MRISSNLFFQTGLNSINAQQADLVHLYRQVGSGKRMVTPSDDPLAAAQAINVSQTLAMGERYAANRKVASQNLGIQDNVLRSVTLQLQDVKTRLVEAGNGTMSDTDRATLAEVLSGARDALLNMANSTDGNGQYLFSGSKGNSAPFTETGKYVGDSSHRLIQVDQTRQIIANDLGSDIFNRSAPGTTGFVTIPGTENNGTGVFGKTIVTNVSSGTAIEKKIEIEFGDPTADPQTYRVSLDGVLVETGGPNDDGVFTYSNGGKLLGGDFGVELEFSGTPALNDRITLVPLSSTYTVDQGSTMAIARVSQYDEGAPAFTITYDADTATYIARNRDDEAQTLNVDFDSTSNPPVLTVKRDSDDTVVAEVTLYETPTPGASATIRRSSGSTSREEFNLFASLDDIIKALENPATTPEQQAKLQNALNSALQRVDVTYNNVLSVQASAGTRMNEIASLDSNGAARVLDYKYQLSQLEDLDYYTAITQLQLRTTALEAAAMAFQKIQNTSLFNLNARG